MNKYLVILILIILGVTGCKAQKKIPSAFLPQDYVIYKQHFGDLNNDGQEDCILIIKGTDKKNIVTNRFEKIVDRNRRGIIVLLNTKGNYELATKNYACFYSENEDGGNYYAPQLNITVENGNLIIAFEHGRYGFWSYSFKYQDANFKLIEYNSGNDGPMESDEIHINFLTKKKLIRENTNENSEGNDEILKEINTAIIIEKLIKLSEIKDFEKLDMSIY